MKKNLVAKAYAECLTKALESFKEKTKTISTTRLLKSFKEEKDSPSTSLWHFSKKADLKELDPDFQGTGTRGKDLVRKDSPVTWFYKEGTPTESIVTKGAVSKYKVVLPEDAKIYDVHSDPEGFWDKASKQRDATKEDKELSDPSVMNHFFKMLKSAGYAGYSGSKGPLPNVVGLFGKTTPTEEVKKPKYEDANWTAAHD